MLFHVYDEPKPEGYYVNEPFGIYRTLLDQDWLLWLLLPLLLAALVYGLMTAWRLHEIPSHKADSKRMRQAELVSALTLLGLFQHWVWAVALFVAYMDWHALEDSIVSMLRRARRSDPSPVDAVTTGSVTDAAVPTPPVTGEAPVQSKSDSAEGSPT